MAEKKERKITAREKLFVAEYLRCFNVIEASRRVGLKDRHSGYDMLRRARVKEYLDKLLSDYQISAGETTKLIGDIAKSNLADYFVTRKVEFTPRIQVPITTVIKRLEDEIEFEEEYLLTAELNKDERGQQKLSIKRMQAHLVRLNMEFKRNPAARKIINGETVLIDKPELDMAKLVADKERGRIKAITPTEWGVKVELCSPDAAMGNLARIQGLFAADNAQNKPNNPTVVLNWGASGPVKPGKK